MVAQLTVLELEMETGRTLGVTGGPASLARLKKKKKVSGQARERGWGNSTRGCPLVPSHTCTYQYTHPNPHPDKRELFFQDSPLVHVHVL